MLNRRITIPTMLLVCFVGLCTDRLNAKSHSKDERNQVGHRFIYPGDENIQSLGLEREALKFWSDADRKRVQKQFDRLQPIFHRFMHLAPDQSVQVGRVNFLSRRNTLAMTYPNAILLSDAYFGLDSKDFDKALLHELTHFSDCARYYSWSRRWLEFCTRNKLRIDSPTVNPFSEALANFVPSILLDENRQEEDLAFIQSLFSDSRKHQSWTIHMRRGFEEKALHNMGAAIAEFKLAARISPMTLMPRIQLSSCYQSLSLREKALIESDRAMTIIHYLDLPYCSFELADFLAARYSMLLEKRRLSDAEKFYAEVTRKCPDKEPNFKRIYDRAQIEQTDNSGRHDSVENRDLGDRRD